jgi:hypothetical protein
VQIAGITKQNGNKNASGAHFFAKKQMGRHTRRSYAIPFVGRADSTGLLAVTLVGYGQLLTSLGAARSQHPTSVLRSHALAEAMLVHAAAVVRLKSSLHRSISLLKLLILIEEVGQNHDFGLQNYTNLFNYARNIRNLA